MFCDLVGSTELSGRLDPEDLREVLRAYQDVCATVTAQFDGHVAKYIGDGLLIYFGYPRAHEDDAQRAVRAGLGFLEEIGRLNEQLAESRGVELAVRVGIHTGLVVTGEMGAGATREPHAIVGETPNIAARIEALAKPDTVVVSGVTRALIEDRFRCEPLGPQALKGVSRPLPIFRVLAESDAAAQIEAAGGGRRVPLIGRQEEIALLERRWAHAKDGEGQVVLLSGAAGIGKSSVLRAFRERIADEPHSRVLYFGSPYHQNSAFHPVIDQLTRGMRFDRGEGIGERLDKIEAVLESLGLPNEPHAAEIAAVLALPADERYARHSLGPEEHKRHFVDTLLTVCEAMARQRPVLMVAEDVHLFDPSTIEYLDRLVERSRLLPMMIIAAFRPDFEPAWARHAHATMLTLNRLSRRESGDMILAMTGGKAVPDAMRDQILERADGVPLFVEELSKMVLESGLLDETADGFVIAGAAASLAIPSSLQDSLTARLDHLSAAKNVAQLAATLGRTFHHELLAAVSSLPERDLAEALDALIDAELIYRRGRPPDAAYEFKHALVRDAAYQSLLKSTRQNYHGRIAQVMTERFPEVAETQPELLAHHFTEAGLLDEAIGYWLRAGRQAVERSANKEAVVQLKAGLQLLSRQPEGQDRDRKELDFQLAMGAPTMMSIGIVSTETEAIYARARELGAKVGTIEDQFVSLWGMWHAYEFRAEWKTAAAYADELMTLARQQAGTDILVQAHHAQWSTKLFTGDWLGARMHVDAGRQLYDHRVHGSQALRFGGHDPGVCALYSGCLAYWALGYPDRARAMIADCLALAEHVNHPPTTASAYVFAAFLQFFLGDGVRTLECADRAVAIARESDALPFLQMGLIVRGWAMAATGRPDDGIAELNAVLGRARQSKRKRGLMPYYLILLADACRLRGDLAEAETALADGLARAVYQDEKAWLSELHRRKADLDLARHGPECMDAEAGLVRALETARDQGVRMLELRAATSLARLWRERGDAERAHALLAPVYGSFDEGWETADLRDARLLLDALA